ncbi:MAG: HD domain-containing phosphohydrolase [Sneathiellaceae bacterium]
MAGAGGAAPAGGLPQDEDVAQGRKTRVFVIAAGILLALVAVVGVALVIGFVDSERSRDLRAWQTRLGIIADTRAAAIREWVQTQARSLRDVADNDSVRLLMTELSYSAWDIEQVPDGEAQRDYIRIFLVSTASATGFTAAARGPEINANVTRVGTAGLAIVTPDNQLVVATPDMPPLDPKLRAFLEVRKPGEAAILDVYRSPSGALSMAFVAPIYAVQADASAEAELGAVIGIRPVQEELERRLVQPGDTSRTSETVLVRESDGQAQYLTTLADGAQPLERRLSRSDRALAANRALDEPGAFGQQVDYRSRPVVMTSRAIEGMPWVLMRKIDESEALEETEYRARVLLATLIGAILLVAIVVVAVWRHGTSMRAAQSAARYRKVAERLNSLSGFLKVVTDNQPTAITAVDAGNRITFVNRQAAASVRQDPADLVGKELGAAFGPALAEELEELNRRARKKGRTMTEVRHRHVAAMGAKKASERILKSDHIPLPAESGREGAVLMVETDITEVERERERREQSMRQLVETLVALIDRRDPYAANHSKRVAVVAAATAGEMGATDIDIRTVEIAAAMTNLGKIAVPEHILAKTDKLSEAELALVRNSIQMSADLLEGVEFDGPVVETLRQMQEHWDGTGMPAGLKGEAILPTARIVALANDFVAMASPRAWRSGLDFDTITGELMKNAGTKYERKVVIALVNHLDNRGGRDAWAHFGEAEPEAEVAGAG